MSLAGVNIDVLEFSLHFTYMYMYLTVPYISTDASGHQILAIDFNQPR